MSNAKQLISMLNRLSNFSDRMYINIIKAATHKMLKKKNYIVYYTSCHDACHERNLTYERKLKVYNQKEIQLIYSGTYNQTSARRK